MADKGLYNLLIDLRANTAQLQRDMDAAVGILQRSSGRIAQITQGIFQGFGQAFGKELINNIGRLSTALGDLAKKGEEAAGIRDNFEKLGGSAASIDAARKAVLGTVDAFDLMRAANEGIIRNIPSLNKNFAMLAEFSNRFADANQRETLPTLNELINALSTGAPKALQQFGIQLEKGATKAQAQAEALRQLPQIMQELAPLGESVAQGQERYNAALSTATKTVDIAINENQELADVYNHLAEQIERIDWEDVGNQIASMIASIASMLPTLQTIVGYIEQAARTIRAITGNETRADILNVGGAQLQSEIVALEKEIKIRQAGGGNFGPVNSRAAQWVDSVFGTELSGVSPEKTAEMQRLLENKRAELQLIAQELGKIKELEKETFGPSQNLMHPRGLGLAFDKKAGRWVDRESLFGGGDQQRTTAGKKTNTELVDDRLRKELAAEDQLAQERSRQAANLLQIEYENRQARLRETADAFEGMFSGVFAELDIDPSLARAAGVFATNIAQGLFTSLEGNKDGLFGIGATIAEGMGTALEAMFGGGSSSASGGGGGGSWWDIFGGSSSGMAGDGMTTDQAHASGIQGPGGQDGNFNSGSQSSFQQGNTAQGYANAGQAGMQLVGAWRNRDDIDKENGDNRGTGAATGGTAGAIIGGIFGGAQGAAWGAQAGMAFGSIVGRFFGRGPSNPETVARHMFSNWLEDRLEEMGGLTVYDRANRNPRTLTNFIEGDSRRFNQPGWADSFNKDPNASAFSGLGLAFKEMLGIEEDIEGQLGFLLFENLEGNINNARMLVQKLGLSFEEIEEKLVQIGLKGEKSWLEIEVAMQGASQAFGEGLVEVGAFGTAMQQVLDTGGRGFEAVQGLRNFAVEAKEAGIQNFEQLRAELEKTFDPETVNAFFHALEQRGIKDLDALAGVSDRVGGGIIADMDAAGAAFKETAATLEDATSNATATLKDSIQALRENTAAVKGIKYAPPEDDFAEEEVAMASGGILTGPTRALMGEAGPEAILPLTRKNGKLGVVYYGSEGSGSSMVFNIDARGAAPGVEHQLRRVGKEIEERIMTRVSRTAQHRRGRVN